MSDSLTKRFYLAEARGGASTTLLEGTDQLVPGVRVDSAAFAGTPALVPAASTSERHDSGRALANSARTKSMQTDDAQFKALVDSGREPTRAEIAALMRTYLAGDIGDSMVDRLDAQFRALLADRERCRAEGSAFRANSHRYFGQAWKELLSPDQYLPSPAELALWLAIVTPGYPPPRPYCPDALVGRWQSASGAMWHLKRDGRFSTTEEHVAALNAVRWCVHLVERRGDFYRDALWLFGNDARHNISPRCLIILECAPDRLRLLLPGGGFPDVEYQLTRVGAA